MLSWYLSTLKQQYDHRADLNRKRGKPLNPVLGEFFQGHFTHPTAGTTHLVSEQVSHHPPVTAYRLWNPDHGISLTGYHAQKTFWENRTINLHKIGQAVLHLDRFDENYLVTFPQLHLEGFLPPPPYPELSDKHPCYIACPSTGYITRLTFSGRSWLRGARHTLSATLFHTSSPTTPLITASGQWSEQITITDHRTSPPTTLESYNAALSPTHLTPLTTPPLSSQHPLESRRLWAEFTAAMTRRDMSAVTAEKSRIETHQRQQRIHESTHGTKWTPRFFTNQTQTQPNRDSSCVHSTAERGVDDQVGKLEDLCGFVNRYSSGGQVKIEPELTAGIWVWNGVGDHLNLSRGANVDVDVDVNGHGTREEQHEKEEEDPFADRYAVTGLGT